ncbi:hypothetical protein COCON_G00113690 [Conger conger]|uniref:SH3 domain-containing protein n=1 Tax=Conger conger TaxID=82655 RepID=A0A9Q1DFD6_CONCO|nr:hypothetical protein COCON_G00113690 [Conger conger]
MSLSTVLAKALFDNVAESSEELAFRKGDILMVLEQGGARAGGPAPSADPASSGYLCPAPSADPASSGYLCPAPSADPAALVYLAPRPLAEDCVYLSPPCVAGGPRARSSSASRPQDWGGVCQGACPLPLPQGPGV